MNSIKTHTLEHILYVHTIDIDNMCFEMYRRDDKKKVKKISFTQNYAHTVTHLYQHHQYLDQCAQ